VNACVRVYSFEICEALGWLSIGYSDGSLLRLRTDALPMAFRVRGGGGGRSAGEEGAGADEMRRGSLLLAQGDAVWYQHANCGRPLPSLLR
jgi:hypothetical protein